VTNKRPHNSCGFVGTYSPSHTIRRTSDRTLESRKIMHYQNLNLHHSYYAAVTNVGNLYMDCITHNYSYELQLLPKCIWFYSFTSSYSKSGSFNIELNI